MSSIVDIIKHYQKSIEKSVDDEARLVHCIGKLYRLPVSVQHLQETGIGRTVNALRKYEGEVGVAAKALVTKWKNMVAAEESDTGEPEPQQRNHDEEDEDNYDESCLQVDEDRHSDDHQEDDEEEEEEEEIQGDDVDDGLQNQQEVESDNREQVHALQQVSNGHDNDHESPRSSHRDSDRHRSSSSSKHRSDRHNQHSSSRSKDSTRSQDRHEKHRDGEKSKHHTSHSSSRNSKDHSSSPSSSSAKKSSKHENEEKEKKDKHSDKKHSSHANDKESTHSSTKQKGSSHEKHHSKSKERLNGLTTTEDESHKRKRASEDEEERAAKKVKHEQPSESKSKSSSKSSSNGSSSSSSKDKSSSSKSSSSAASSKDKDKHRSSEKKKKSSSKRDRDQPPDSVDDEDEDNGGGTSFADALAMIGMPSSSKKKSKVSADKLKTSPSSSSMPPPPAKSDRQRSSSSSGYSSCSSTPPLLAQKPKLAPLPVADIVESLPTISPNYKPMPLNQTVMECVFSNNGKPQKRPMTEEEALGHSMQSKNIRTKVYSGVKNSSGVVPTLYSLCIRLLQENIELIDYTGGIPFDLLKPVLERANPVQLATLEEYNPYLMEDSDILWEQHCKRNFRSQKRKEEECESWREMFARCSEEQESKLLSLTANIKQSQVEKRAPIRKTQLAYVDSAVKPPRNVLSKQARYGTAQTPVVSPAARVAALKNATSNVAKAGDSRLKVAASSRDTAQAQVFHPTKPKKAPLMSKVMQSIKGFKGFRR